jgi:membrane protein
MIRFLTQKALALKTLAPRLLRFARRVLRDFFLHNNGLLLTSAVAYNALLSMIPLAAVLVVLFSNYFEEELLLDTVASEVALFAPGAAILVDDVVKTFLESRELAGWIGVGVLLFFSSMAFRVLENAIAIIFHRTSAAARRKFWISALLPYVFIGLTATGLIIVTGMASFFEATAWRSYEVGGFELALQQVGGVVLRLVGWLGLVLLFTTLYRVMPATRVSFRLALSGGVTAAVLWEGLRFALTWYFSHLSFINAIYGSMATTIVALVTMEAAALIVLLGAQVIADLQQSLRLGKSWDVDLEERGPDR